MSEPVQIVTQFLETINEGPDGFGKAVSIWFTPETVWENVGMSTTTGADQALDSMQQMAAAGFAGLRIENLAVAAQGDKVLTERIDYLLDSSGATKLEVRCMGIFDINVDGKIVRWADYFDPGVFRNPPKKLRP